MKIYRYTCDRCGKVCTDDGEIHLRIDRRMDAAGSMDDDMFAADLCPHCIRKFVHYILGKQTGIKFPGVHLKEFIKIKAVERG